MNVLLFLAEHWQDILVIILIVASSITGLNKWTKKNGPILAQMTVQEKIAYTTRLLTNLAPIALALVTKAEIDYGGGTGVLKRSYVIDELYKRIPDEYKKYIKTKKWKTISKEVKERANNKCEICGSEKKLVTHHHNYINVYNETHNDLLCICNRCHETIHHGCSCFKKV